jgi:ABC-2 type transport system ATP-binding protein
MVFLMPEDVIQVERISKTYREGFLSRKSVNALRGVDLRVPRGSIFGLLGPNGAGKTTLIKILLGLVKRTAGEGQLLGRPLGDRRGRRQIGYLPEHHRFPRHLTGNAALLYYGGLNNLSRREILAKRSGLLERVGLESWGDVSVTKYSKGMQQRLGIAQALLHQPDLLILDEPTDGVDPVGRSEVRSLLKQLRSEGATIFLNSHQLQEIELVCDRAAILSKGQVQRIGTIEELTRHPQTAMQFVLRGPIEVLREALSSFETQSWESTDDGVTTVNVSVPDQLDVNRCIDRLRQHQIDIREIRRMRNSLEEAFLEIVAGEPGESSA